MKKNASYILTAIISSSVMVAPFIVAQIWFWEPNWMIVAGYAVLGWLPLWIVLATQKKAESPDDEDEQTKPSTPANTIYSRTILLAGLAWTLTLCGWHLQETRMHAAKKLGHWRVREPLNACLSDESTDVAIACCQAAEPMGSTFMQDRYARWLVKHPTKANACMVQSINGTSTAANTLGQLVAQKWAHQLRTTPESEDKQTRDMLCQQATHLRHLDRIPEANTSAQLLLCAASAKNIAARHCCAQQLQYLAGNNMALTALPDPQKISQTPFQQHTNTLLTQLLPGDKAMEDKRQAMLEKLPFPANTMQQWSLSLACHTLKHAQPMQREQIMTRMQIAMSTNNCELAATQLTYLRFQSACDALDEQTSTLKEPLTFMCQHVQTNLVENTVTQAHRLISAAHFRAYQPYWNPKDKLLKALWTYDKRDLKKFESERKKRITSAAHTAKKTKDGKKKMDLDTSPNSMMNQAIQRAKDLSVSPGPQSPNGISVKP